MILARYWMLSDEVTGYPHHGVTVLFKSTPIMAGWGFRSPWLATAAGIGNGRGDAG
jgi:hypothetical protein